jgi:hypothetical protein
MTLKLSPIGSYDQSGSLIFKQIKRFKFLLIGGEKYEENDCGLWTELSRMWSILGNEGE